MNIFVIFIKNILNKHAKDKEYPNAIDHYHCDGQYRGAPHIIFDLNYNVHQETSIDFQSGSKYNNHFIIKDLAEDFAKQFTCLRKNTETCINILVQIEKEVKRIGERGKEIMKALSYRLQDLWSVNC